MQTTTLALGLSHLLVGVVARQWTVAAYTGLQCNGEQLTIHEPSQDPSPDRECRVLEHHVQTASVVLAVSEDTTDTWIFGLHESPEDNSCIYDVEGAGSYTLQPGANSVCIQLQGEESTFSVDKKLGANTRRVEEYAVSVRDPGDLAVRMPNNGYTIIFAAASASSIALGNAIVLCGDGVEGSWAKASGCGILAIGALFAAIAGGLEYRGLLQAASQATGGEANLLLAEVADHYASQLGLDDGPMISNSTIDGYTTTFTRLPSLTSRSDDDSMDTFIHLAMQSVNRATGEVQSALIDLDTVSNATTVSSIPVSSNSLNRRQELNDFTAYYSWDNWDYDESIQFPQTEEGQRVLAQEVWDYMMRESAGAFCASLALPDFNGLPQSVNNGYFGFISGTFSDRKTSC